MRVTRSKNRENGSALNLTNEMKNCKHCGTPPLAVGPRYDPNGDRISNAWVECACGWKSPETISIDAAILIWDKIMHKDQLSEDEEVALFSKQLYTETGFWPKTEAGWCAYHKRLDAVYDKESPQRPRDIKGPLHHDSRCKKCIREKKV